MSITTPTRTHRETWKSLDVVVAVAGGLALGAFCAVSDRPSAASSTLAQMVTPWVSLAAIAGAVAGKRRHVVRAAFVGALALAAASTTYAVLGAAAYGVFRTHDWLVWTAVGIVVGPTAAIAGHESRRGGAWLQPLAAAGIASVCFAETVVLWRHIDHARAHATYVVVAIFALLIPAAVVRGTGPRAAVRSYGLMLGLIAPIVLVLEVAFQALGIV